MNTAPTISVNAGAAALVERFKATAAEFKVGVRRGELGETLIDAGSSHAGSIAAGLQLAEICMGGLGAVALTCDTSTPRWPWTLTVRSSHPVIACLASQYAGWSLSHREGSGTFSALGSGPARAIARKEALFEDIGYQDRATVGTLVMETSRPPPSALVAEVARACALQPEQLTFIYAPTQSLAGGVQVVARVLEVALHKAHELGFPLDRIVDGMGAAPLAPPHPDLIAAMGRANDAIIYGGRVHLFLTGSASDASELAKRLPSQQARDYGRPFAEIFRRFNHDFYAIDRMLFSPAEAIVTALETGQSFHQGHIDLDLLDASFS